MWLNFSNIFFSERGTIEFRPSTPTVSPVKTISWLFLCIAILEYCKKNTTDILTKNKVITLSMISDIFEENNSEDVEAIWLSSYLKAYLKSRKNEQYDYIKKDDFNGKDEINTDAGYSFIHLGESIA